MKKMPVWKMFRIFIILQMLQKSETKCLETSGFAAYAVGGSACLAQKLIHVAADVLSCLSCGRFVI